MGNYKTIMNDFDGLSGYILRKILPEVYSMPKGTKVDSCYQKLKGTKGKASAAAICQKSTGQSLKTGKSIKKK